MIYRLLYYNFGIIRHQLRKMSNGKIQRKIICSSKAPQPIGPYSQAVKIGSTLYISGQLGIDATKNQFAGDDITAQSHQTMKNLVAILEESGLTAKNLIKCTVLLKNIGDFDNFNKVYQQYVVEPYPARIAFEASNLPKNGLVEVEAIACAEEILDH